MSNINFADEGKAEFEMVSEESYVGLKKLDHTLEKAKEHLTTWAGDGATQLNRKLEDLKSGALDKIVVAGKTLEQDVDLGMNQYNTKVQDLVEQIPGGFSRKAARYPWVTISIFLVIGILIGMLLKPARRISGSLQVNKEIL